MPPRRRRQRRQSRHEVQRLHDDGRRPVPPGVAQHVLHAPVRHQLEPLARQRRTQEVPGDGHSACDCAVSPDGQSVALRAERNGGCAPTARSYPVWIAATDDCGNVTAGAPAHACVPHDRGLVWTTDAFFRETPAKVARRREQGCLAVDMEVSAMFACAAFRGAAYAQLLYAGDDVSAAEWDHRHWEKQTGARDRLLDLALDAVVRL